MVYLDLEEVDTVILLPEPVREVDLYLAVAGSAVFATGDPRPPYMTHMPSASADPRSLHLLSFRTELDGIHQRPRCRRRHPQSV